MGGGGGISQGPRAQTRVRTQNVGLWGPQPCSCLAAWVTAAGSGVNHRARSLPPLPPWPTLEHFGGPWVFPSFGSLEGFSQRPPGGEGVQPPPAKKAAGWEKAAGPPSIWGWPSLAL